MLLLIWMCSLMGCTVPEESDLSEEITEEVTEEEAVSPETENSNPDGTLTVTFLDVGQGNAVLVENNGAYMLIDGGDRDYSSYVVSYLKAEGVEKLDYVISSHYDADHLNGIVGVLHAFPCDLLLDADYTTDTRVYDALLSVTEEKNLVEVHPDMGTTYSFQDASFTIVCPDAYDYEDDNDNSIGIRLVYGETSFLICGDAGSRVEDVMMQSGLDLTADVYLASHHGSAYSSSMAFMESVNPKAVVISAGAGNSYGHPSEEVLDHIKNLGADLYRTDLQGTIRVTSDGTDLSWNVEPSKDYRSGAAVNADQTGAQETESVTESITDTEGTDADYILNRNTKKFHLPSCSSVKKISESNKAAFFGTREELIEAGYEPCGNCKP